MLDKWGRNINYLRISVTDRCNLKCIYCVPKSGFNCIEEDKLLSLDEIYRIVKLAASLGISRIRFTGGEPLVRTALTELIKEVKKVPGIKEVCLTTNGILLKDYIDRLAEAGLDNVNISLDTLIEEKFKHISRGGDLNRVIDAINTAERVIPKVRINTVIMKDINEDEIMNFVALTKIHNIDVRFIELMPLGEGAKFSLITNSKIKQNIEEKFELENESKFDKISGPAVYYKIPDWNGRIGFISPMSHSFCTSCNRARLTCEGFLKQCLHLKNGIDLRELMRNGSSDDKIRHILKNAIFYKPENHSFLSKCEDEDNRAMYQIGG